MTFPLTALQYITVVLFIGADAAHGAQKSAVGLPNLDIKSSCGEAQRFSTKGNEKGAAYKGCMEDELGAKDQLLKRWLSFKPDDRKVCIEQGRAPVPSYVEILTCMEMSSGNMFGGGKNLSSGSLSAPKRSVGESAK